MEIAVIAGLALLGLGIALCGIRAAIGPSSFDRALAFDCISYNFAGAILLVSILLRTSLFLDVVLVVALLGFLATVSIAFYLEGSLVD